MTYGGTCLALPVELLPLDVSENFFDLQLVSISQFIFTLPSTSCFCSVNFFT